MKLKKPRLIEQKVKILIITSILGWLVYIIGAIADSVFAGFQCEEALAAVEVVAPFYSFIMFIPYLFCDGAAILFSNAIGKGDPKEAHKIYGLGLLATMTVAGLTALSMWLFKDNFLSAFIDKVTEATVYRYASEYYDWFIGVAIIYPLYGYTYRLISEDAEIFWTLASDVVQMVTNLVLSAILINVMGVAGLGLSTFISVTLSAIVAWAHLLSKKNNVKLGIKFSFKDMWQMLILGAGKWLSVLFVAVVDLVLNAFIANKFGVALLACYAVVNLAISLGELFSSVSGSICGFITISNAQNNNNEIKNLMKYGMKWEIGICLFFTVLFGAFCWAVPSIYGIDSSSPLFHYSWLAILIISLTYVFYGMVNLYGSYYASLEKPMVSVIGQTSLQFVFPIAFAIILSLIFNSFIGIIIGIALASPLSFIAIVIYLKKVNKTHKVVEYPICNETQFAYDLYLTEEEIVKTRDLIGEKLKSIGEERVSMKIMMVVEDLLFLIKKENSDAKKPLMDKITICVNENQVRVLNKDSGRIFDVYRTAKNERLDNENFVLFTMLPVRKSIRNNIMMSFNSTSLTINKVAPAK